MERRLAHLAVLDWIVLAAFFGALALVLVAVLGQRKRDTEDYFLAGRDAGWLAIGASIFAANIGSDHLVGLAGAGARTGMAMAHWELQSWLLLILGWVFVPFYWRSRVFTMPEFLERRYSSATRTFLSAISLVSYVLTKGSATVYAGGVVIKTVVGIESIGGVDFFWIAAIGLVAISGLYTVVGGMKAVLWTAVLQAPVLIAGGLLVVCIGLAKVGGLAEMTRLTGEQIHLVRPLHDPDFPWLGVLLASPLVGFWYWCTDQYIVQRVLSAKGLQDARRGSIFAGYLKILPVFIFLFPGMIALALSKQGVLQLGSPDEAFPLLVSELLPIGVKGLVVGSLIAGLMGSLASLFNSSATLFTVDFYKKLRPATSELRLVRVGRVATACVVVLSVAWIPVMRMISGVLFEYLQMVQALIGPGIAAVFLLGVFSPRITPAAGLVGLSLSFALGMLRLGLMIFASHIGEHSALRYLLDLHWLYYCVWIFVATCGVMVGVSCFTRAPRASQIDGLTFRSVSAEQRREVRSTWNYWDVAHSLAIVGAVAAVYVYFW